MQIDVSGTVCPQPVAIVRRCLEELEAGDDLVVTGDYPPAERSIRRTCYRHGYAVADEEPVSERSGDEGAATERSADETFTLRIRVTEEAVAGRSSER